MIDKDKYIGQLIKLDNEMTRVYGVIEDVDDFGWTIKVTAVPMNCNGIASRHKEGERFFVNHSTPYGFTFVSKKEIVRVYAEAPIIENLDDMTENEIDNLYAKYKDSYDERHNLKIKETYIDNIKMEHKTFAVLRRNGLKTLEEIASMTRKKFMSCNGIGEKTAYEIENILKENNLAFKGE